MLYLTGHRIWWELIFLENFKCHGSVAFHCCYLRGTVPLRPCSPSSIQLLEVLRIFPLSWCSEMSRCGGMGQSAINIYIYTHTHTHTHIRDKDSFCVGNLMYPFSLKAHVLQFRGIALYYSFCVISFLSCSLFSHSESPLIQLWILLYLSSNFLWAPSLFFCLFKFWGFFLLSHFLFSGVFFT